MKYSTTAVILILSALANSAITNFNYFSWGLGCVTTCVAILVAYLFDKV